MVSVYDLKTKFQNILRPTCNSLAQKNITANQVTVTALVLSLIYAALLCTKIPVFWILLPLFLLVRMGLNAIDGMLAREHDMKSTLGMALNELGDVISDTALFIPFAFIFPQMLGVIFAFITLALLTEFCGLLAFMMSGQRRYDGPMGKSDRAFVTGTLALIFGFGFLNPLFAFWAFVIMNLLCLLCCYNRIKSALKIKDSSSC